MYTYIYIYIYIYILSIPCLKRALYPNWSIDWNADNSKQNQQVPIVFDNGDTHTCYNIGNSNIQKIISKMRLYSFVTEAEE